MSRFYVALFILLTPAIAFAVPQFPQMDTPTFVAKATDILIVRCVNSDVLGGGKTDGLTLIEVEVIAVIKGDRKAGKSRLGTIGQPMEAGKRYLAASFGGDVFGTGFLAQSDQAIVELPSDFDLKWLAGKTAVGQAQAVFDARRAEVARVLQQLQREKETLEHAVPKKEYQFKVRFVSPGDKVEPVIIVPTLVVLDGKTAEHRTGYMVSHGGGPSNIPAGGQSVRLKCSPAWAGKVHLHLEAERSKVISSSPPVSTVNVELKVERQVPVGEDDHVCAGGGREGADQLGRSDGRGGEGVGGLPPVVAGYWRAEIVRGRGRCRLTIVSRPENVISWRSYELYVSSTNLDLQPVLDRE